MKCDQIIPYLPGFAGGGLPPDTARIVADHLAGCRACTTEVDTHRRVVGSLATLAVRDVEPPPFMLDAILEGIGEHKMRYILPFVPLPMTDVARVLADNREAIA